MVALDKVIVTTALSTIQRDLSASVEALDGNRIYTDEFNAIGGFYR